MKAIGSGSYAPEDVIFLLKPVDLAPIEVAEKERRIQIGAAHYSEMISRERRPDARYLSIFEEALARHLGRLGHDIACLAETLARRVAQGALPNEITLCSLVRAGVPYGVVLRRALVERGVDCVHYGVSIIRDRGLDPVAMDHVLSRRNRAGIVFVDGWTGKGAIASELRRAWAALGHAGRPQLVVLTDPAGVADLAAGHEDWLIPSGILGANVSGLVSRTVLNRTMVGPGDFHGTVHVGHLQDIDMSRRYVDAVSQAARRARACPIQMDPALQAARRAASEACVSCIAKLHAVENRTRIKPGIAEATRAVLRRRPDRVFLRDAADPDLAALVHLCRADGVPLVESRQRTGPYRAITLIRNVTR